MLRWESERIATTLSRGKCSPLDAAPLTPVITAPSAAPPTSLGALAAPAALPPPPLAPAAPPAAPPAEPAAASPPPIVSSAAFGTVSGEMLPPIAIERASDIISCDAVVVGGGGGGGGGATAVLGEVDLEGPFERSVPFFFSAPTGTSSERSEETCVRPGVSAALTAAAPSRAVPTTTSSTDPLACAPRRSSGSALEPPFTPRTLLGPDGGGDDEDEAPTVTTAALAGAAGADDAGAAPHGTSPYAGVKRVADADADGRAPCSAVAAVSAGVPMAGSSEGLTTAPEGEGAAVAQQRIRRSARALIAATIMYCDGGAQVRGEG